MKASHYVSLLVLACFPCVSTQADDCINPGDNTLCSSECQQEGETACLACCGTQYTNKTNSSWGFIRAIKRLYYHSELQACQHNCEMDNLDLVVVSQLDLSIEISRYIDGDERGWLYTYSNGMRVFVATGPDELQGRVRFVGTKDEVWVGIRTSETEMYLETPSGSSLLCTAENGIDSNASAAFEAAISPYGSDFRSHLEALSDVSGLGIKIADAYGPLVADLLQL